MKRHSSARHGLALSRCARRIGAQHAARRFRRQIAIRAQCAKTSKKTRAGADMQEQSQPPIPRGHCQSRHDKFPHARIAHSGPPITASAPREKNGAASSFQSPCKSVRKPFPNPARARRHRRENRPNVWNNASYIGFPAESPNLYAAYPQIPTFRFLARPKAFYAFFALGSNEPVSETVRTARGKPHA